MARRLGLTLAVALTVVVSCVGAASAQQYPPADEGQQISDTTLMPGQPFTVSGGGFKPNTEVTVTFDATVLGRVLTRPDGTFSITVTTPADASPGRHTITSTGTAPDGSIRRLTSIVTVLGTVATRGPLPRTGASVLPLAAGGTALIGIGSAAVAGARRRRTAAAAARRRRRTAAAR